MLKCSENFQISQIISNTIQFMKKKQEFGFLFQEIDVKTAMSFIDNLAQFSQISFAKNFHFSNFALCFNQDRFFKV